MNSGYDEEELEKMVYDAVGRFVSDEYRDDVIELEQVELKRVMEAGSRALNGLSGRAAGNSSYTSQTRSQLSSFDPSVKRLTL